MPSRAGNWRMFIAPGFACAIMWFVWAAPGRAQPSLSCNLQGAKAATNNQDAYGALKALEGCFQPPTSSATAVVGTFDPATGNFIYAPQVVAKQISAPMEEENVSYVSGKGQTGGSRPVVVNQPQLVGFVAVNAVNVSLSFQSANRSPIEVVAKQISAGWMQLPGTTNITAARCVGTGTCPWPQTVTKGDWASSGMTATVNAGQSSAVAFTLKSGSKTFTGYVLIVRPPVVGLGAFTVPAIPLTIVYAPPLGLLKKNTNAYSITTTAGTSASMTVSQDNSTTKPAEFVTSTAVLAGELKGALANVPGLGSSTLGMILEAVKAEVDVISQISGSISGTNQQGITFTQNHTLTTSVTNGNSFITADNVGGPGLEDEFFLLHNAQFMWLAAGGQLRVTIIGAKFMTVRGYELLQHKDDPQLFFGLDSKTIKTLLTLDPFTAPYVNTPFTALTATPNGILGPSPMNVAYAPGTAPMNSSGLVPPLPQIPPRWSQLMAADLLGNAGYNQSTTISQSDTSTNANYSVDVTDMKAGMLSFMAQCGPDICQTQTNTTKSTTTYSLTTTDTQTSTSNANFVLGQNEALCLQPYYDVPLGTFAFVPTACNSQPVLTGIASNAAGQLLANQVVVLQIAGKQYTTKTDAHGRYAFYSASIKRGTAATLLVGGVRKPILIAAPLASSITVRPN